MPKNKVRRSDAEEKEYYKGLVRKRDKRIKLLEREVSRLNKYLMKDNTEYDWDDEESQIKAPRKIDAWVCDKCGSTECDELILSQRNLVRKYITCRACGNRSRVEIDGKLMATDRQ